MQDAWRAYLELALGVTEASRKKAVQVIRSLAEQSGARVEDLQGMAEDLLSAGMANRDSLTKLVRFELDRALSRVGLATTEEVDDLKQKVRDLELQLRQAREEATAAERAAAAAQAAAGEATQRSAVKKSTQKTTAKKAAKKAAGGTKAATSKKATVSKKAAAKKTTKKATAKKTTAKRTVKKTTGGDSA